MKDTVCAQTCKRGIALRLIRGARLCANPESGNPAERLDFRPDRISFEHARCNLRFLSATAFFGRNAA
ncbi:hypothetical protein [uncultured Bradyrhizobium sp.]|uniref:hypothetical protein n=1 Tax=uncultured Bradyrhizobium sp. TaxID=199684 RepID=UPI0035CB2614